MILGTKAPLEKVTIRTGLVHTFTMDDSEPPDTISRCPRPPSDRQEGRRRCCGVFSKCMTTTTSPPAQPQVMDTSMSDRESLHSHGIMTHATSPSTTVQRACVAARHQRQPSDAPSLVSENNHEQEDLIAEEPSIEVLQMDIDFIQKQHAILDQIRVDSSHSRDDLRDVTNYVDTSTASTDTACFSGIQDTRPSTETGKTQLMDISQDSSDDFLQYLNDPSVLEEQRRIMDTIMNESQHSLRGHAEPRPRESPPSFSTPSSYMNDQGGIHSSLSTSVWSSTTLGYMEEAATCISLPNKPTREKPLFIPPVRSISEPNVRNLQSSMSSSPTRASSASARLPTQRNMMDKKANEYTSRCEQDALIELYQGKKIQVRGTNHTWKSIAKGNATLVQCPVCFTILQVGASAKLLFCTRCNEVSPIGVHTDGAVMDYRADGLIAVVVQQQEVDVAFAKKMARNAAASNNK